MWEKYEAIFTVFNTKKKIPLNFFNSEGFFWLTLATSAAFAGTEICKNKKHFPELKSEKLEPRKPDHLIDMLKECVRIGEISEQVQNATKDSVMYNIRLLKQCSQKCGSDFSPEAGIILGKTYINYWLVFKLIELEWQRTLSIDATQETYTVLDSLICDIKELEELEINSTCGRVLTEDQLIFLQCCWERGRNYWGNLADELELLKEGLIKFVPPISEV